MNAYIKEHKGCLRPWHAVANQEAGYNAARISHAGCIVQIEAYCSTKEEARGLLEECEREVWRILDAIEDLQAAVQAPSGEQTAATDQT